MLQTLARVKQAQKQVFDITKANLTSIPQYGLHTEYIMACIEMPIVRCNIYPPPIFVIAFLPCSCIQRVKQLTMAS